MTQHPLISIMIRSMARDSLKTALDSVARQSWPNVEVLVVNASGKPHPPLPKNFPFLSRLLDNSERVQRSRAANQLLEHSQGVWGLFLDDDDGLEPDHLSRLAMALQDNPDRVLAYSDVSCVEQKPGKKTSDNEIRRYEQPFEPLRLLLENYIPIHAALFRLERVRSDAELRFDPEFDLFEDWDFWLQLLQLGDFVHVPGVSAWYRIHSASGAGVRLAESDQADAALLQLLEKWRDKWSIRQIYELFGLARHVYPLQNLLSSEQERANQLELERERLKISLNELERLYAKEQESANQLVRDNQLLKLNFKRLEQIQKRVQQNADAFERENQLLTQNFKSLEQLHDQVQHKADEFERDNSILRHHMSTLETLYSTVQEKAEQMDRDTQTLHSSITNLEQLLSAEHQAVARLTEEQARLQKVIHELNLTQQQMQHNHENALREVREHYENSRSWQITRPLRALIRRSGTVRQQLAPGYHRVRRALSFRTLQVLTRIYHSSVFAPVASLVPPILKRRIRNFLFRNSTSFEQLPGAGSFLLRPMSEDTLVSIVIPVYNHAQYLRQCLDSALEQSWVNLEVIVVNDASPDPQVREILDSYADQSRMKIIHMAENGGICQAQNQALIASAGQVIAFLDCDDYLHPEAIRISMEHWQDDTVYAHTGRINVDEQGEEINRIHFVELPREDYFQENLRAMYATHLKLIRRDAFVKVGLFDPRFDTAQDYEMLMRIAFHYPSSSFVHVPDFVYCHRLHQQQATERQNDKQQRLTLQIQKEARLRESIRNGDYPRFVSFIMLSYGKHSQTLEAIRGLQRTVNIPHEIILYDNGSTAETVEFIRRNIDGQFDSVQVIYGEYNLGPAQGRRKALEYARGEWFIIFDNDEIPEPGWLEELLLRAEVNDNVGAVSCRVVFPDGKLQFSAGYAEIDADIQRIDLKLYDMGEQYTNLGTCVFREADWCPIGATLFTENIAPYLHSGYPNVFEDAGVSYALKKKGLRLLNAPGALVWHDHITYRDDIEMGEEYMKARYNPQKMLISVASFYRENGLIIYDEYVWRENKLHSLSQSQLIDQLKQTLPVDERL